MGLRSRGDRIDVGGRCRSVADLALETLPRVRHHLIEVARSGGTTTYGDLVRDLSLPSMARGLGPLLDLLGVDCARRDEPNLAIIVVTGSSGEVGTEYGTGAAEERARIYACWNRPRT